MAFDATYWGANALLVRVWLDGIDSAYAKDGFSAGAASAANANTRLLFTLSASSFIKRVEKDYCLGKQVEFLESF